ncbi:MAG: ribbon-helix-helix domain-containing protein [Bacteroidetes bacterium]|nr:ribbon-helix-helix domain-containing protein [Bacteroidota bacterium]
MTTFTSSLPDDLLQSLNTLAGKLSIPKNKIIEKALRIYIDQINRAEYVQSFKNAADDIDVLDMAEEGMEDYLKQLD